MWKILIPVIALLLRMLITCASHQKDLHESPKFVLRYIRCNFNFIFVHNSQVLHLFSEITNLGFDDLQYIRKLLFSDLDKSSIEHVLRQLRKLPWSECEAYLLKCFMKVHRGKYGQIHLIASLTAGLSRYHDEFAVSVVDEVCSFQ